MNAIRVSPNRELVGLLVCLCLAGCATPRKQALNPVDYDSKVRVACVGDSITYGSGIERREENSYPAVLGRLLGLEYETRNLGVSGATLSKQGDKPYWGLSEFQALERFQPQAIILKLGTNDTKPQNWRSAGAFRMDLEAMLDHFAGFASQPKIWVCLPVPVYETRWGINEEVLNQEIIPVIREVAVRRHLPVIDLHTALSDRPEFFPDRIHPDATGAAMIAMAVRVALKGRY